MNQILSEFLFRRIIARSTVMRWVQPVIVCFLLIAALSILTGRYQNRNVSLNRVSFQQPTVEIGRNVPSRFKDANLHLSIYTGKYNAFTIQGLSSPSSGEDRLVAITTNGFEIVFAPRGQAEKRKATVLFRYGLTTETNIFDWKIVGKFE